MYTDYKDNVRACGMGDLTLTEATDKMSQFSYLIGAALLAFVFWKVRR